ncbi:hypothetical protein JCM5350_001828, partial [Sporobolomyces pararoseus]
GLVGGLDQDLSSQPLSTRFGSVQNLSISTSTRHLESNSSSTPFDWVVRVRWRIRSEPLFHISHLKDTLQSQSQSQSQSQLQFNQDHHSQLDPFKLNSN